MYLWIRVKKNQPHHIIVAIDLIGIKCNGLLTIKYFLDIQFNGGQIYFMRVTLGPVLNHERDESVIGPALFD